MSALSRRKGAAWQAELARRWRESGLYPDAYSTQGAQKFGPGPKPPDVDGTPWAVECKHTRACNPVAALRQAIAEKEARRDERVPIAVVRPHGEGADGAVVVMRLTDFEGLITARREGWESQ